MLQHEFESLTGLKVNESQYEVINGMYGCSNNQTKQDFCKMFMAMELMSHVDYVVNLRGEKIELDQKYKKAVDEVIVIAKKNADINAELHAVRELLRFAGKTIAQIGVEMVKGAAE